MAQARRTGHHKLERKQSISSMVSHGSTETSTKRRQPPVQRARKSKVTGGGDSDGDVDEAARRRLQAAMDAKYGYLFGVEEEEDKDDDDCDDVIVSNQTSVHVEDMRSDDDDEEDDEEDEGHSDESEASPAVDVVVFEGDGSGTRNQHNNNGNFRKNRRSFMSSDIRKVSGARRPPSPTLWDGARTSDADAAQERQDAANDRELAELLRTSRLVEQYAAADLAGRDRIDHQKAMLVRLGAKPARQPSMPAAIRAGMRAKAHQRALQKLQTAKDTGVYHDSLRAHIMGDDGVVAGIDEKRSKREAAGRKRPSKRSDGLFGSVGTIRDGVMRVAKKHIDAVNNRPSNRNPASKKKSRGIKMRL